MFQISCGNELIIVVVQNCHYRSGNKAVDAEEIPASALKPFAKPLQGKKSCKKCKGGTD
jgi:hypothetical protein